ncbi:Aminoglycoside phosphotransferase [Penicillium citrinum]|uniref:Aminoglycoside phosphotransferase n=1 Tax=Penicillium citrinum TaxID=5077 RepID=A0A9W9NK94_PENCI|nr:Aminoglycoside phosphotransferase [Penicillium citrinum]KAJ5221445.1 Aminoglycoside phosphotransferase [Penicillium citrinum]
MSRNRNPSKGRDILHCSVAQSYEWANILSYNRAIFAHTKRKHFVSLQQIPRSLYPKSMVFAGREKKAVAITMDYMHGKGLDEISITNELHFYINQLRGLKGDYVGAVDRGKAIIGRRISMEGGPFDTEQQFNESNWGDLVQSAPDLLRHYAKYALTDDHEIVFTHADISPRNILVEEGHVIVILDWEDAGWYPAYWEYTQVLRQLKLVPDWPEYISRILPPKFEREYVGMSFLALILSH